MKKMIKSMAIFVKAIPSVILFELLYKIIITALALPALARLLEWAIDISGVGYITSENLMQFLTYPASFLLIILLLIICSVLSLIEISAIISGFGLIYKGEKIKVSLMLKTGLRSIKKLFRKFNFMLIFYILLFFPLTQFTLTSGVFAFIGMPSVQTLYGIASSKIFIGIIIFMLIISLFLITRIYCLNFFTLTDLGYLESIRKSKAITENKRIKTAFSIILWIVFITFVFLALFFILCFLILFAVRGFSEPENAVFNSLRIIEKMIKIFTAFSSVFFTPMLFAYITSCFMAEIGEDIDIQLPRFKNISPIKMRLSLFIIFGLAIILNYSFMKDISAENLMLNASFLNKTKVTAHRGFSAEAPENTEPAFEKALEVGSDFIELDVQLSKDGRIIVFHDKNLLRITGDNEFVRNKSYSELLELDYGKWFGDEFENTPIMTLDEVLENFGDKINLNIEVKKNDDENITAELTAKLVEEYGCEDTCYITSFSYDALRTVKKINPDIKTGLIANIMTYGGYSTLHDIDALSLNKKFVSQNLVNNIHLNGKRLFVWTVNERAEAEKLMNMGVDNIITDNPDMVIETISSKGVDGYIISFLSRIFNY